MARATPDEPLVEERITARVTRATLADGQIVAIKRAAPDAPVTREASVLRFLGSRGCAVPAVVEATADVLVTEWCGDTTLDDALQDGCAVGVASLMEAVFGVGRALAEVVPNRAVAAEQLRAQLAPWVAALPDALAWLCGAAHETHEALLGAVLDRALACAPEPGSLDYTSRNVLLDAARQRVWLIDFAATGFDWTERRLAQYALATGAGRPAGLFSSALDGAACAALDDATGLDAHEVLLLLTAAEHLRQVEAGAAHEERRNAWANVAERRASLLTLMRRPLASRGAAAALRAALR